jgi:prepilin-type N-terminal cleavage/methylation domain-containing protein
MKIFGRETSGERQALESAPDALYSRRRAFTLIEIMVAIGILAIILAIGIPSVYQQLHKDSMRQAIADITELCREARNEAVLRGITVELRISPANRSLSVNLGTAPSNPTGTSAVNADEARETFTGGASASTSKKVSDHILFHFLEVNRVPNPELADRSCFFYSNGTADELGLVIRSDRGEVRKITTDVVTGIPDVEEGK